MEPIDPILLSNTREWLQRTKEDLDAAALVLTVSSPLVRTALSHCQQAVEKPKKAFLTWHDAAFREVHNLEELSASCIRLDSTLASAVTRVTVLTKYAVRFRYPGAPYEPDVEEAQESLGLAQEFVLARLPRGLWKRAGERAKSLGESEEWTHLPARWVTTLVSNCQRNEAAQEELSRGSEDCDPCADRQAQQGAATDAGAV